MHDGLFRILLLVVLLLGPLSVDSYAAEAPSATPNQTPAADTNENIDRQPPVWRFGLLAAYCVLIVGASLFGGMLPSLIHLSHTRMQLIISFVGGLMLGIGLLHLLPHAAAELGSTDRAALWMIGGVMTMFLLIRTFHVHHHSPVELPPGIATPEHEHKHDHDHDHDHSGHEHHHGAANYYQNCEHTHQYSWIGITLGLALHTLIDGIALGASVEADAVYARTFSLLGLGTFFAILMHKPLDAVSITSLMAVGGWSQKWRNIVNLSFALMCPLGTLLFLFGVNFLAGSQPYVLGAALAFSAGVFVCISLSDLLPEMEFHSHNRGQLTLTLIAGLALAWALTLLEPAHLHAHNSNPSTENVSFHVSSMM